MPRKNLPRPVDIVYRRLPNDVRELPGVLRQVTPARLVIESPITVQTPQRIQGRIIADSGFIAIWFVYRHKWYDVGKFYDRARNLVGYYCDIIMPLNKLLRTPAKTNMITDLFLELWITPEGDYVVLDETWISTENPGKPDMQGNGFPDSRVPSGTVPPSGRSKGGTLGSCNGGSHELNVLVSLDANAASRSPFQVHTTSLKKNSGSLKIGFRDLPSQRKTVP